MKIKWNIKICKATHDSNKIVNDWRLQSNINPRPLGLSSDKQRDPLCGLYVVELDKQVVGGFGLKRRLFWEEAVDNFRPYDGIPLLGYFFYGSVIRSDLRGKGLFTEINMRAFHIG